MIKQVLTDGVWGERQYLIIDTPPGTSDEHISVVENIKKLNPDGAVLVTTPQVHPPLHQSTPSPTPFQYSIGYMSPFIGASFPLHLPWLSLLPLPPPSFLFPLPPPSFLFPLPPPQGVALADVRREVTFCHKTGIPILGIVENMSGFVCPHCSVSLGGLVHTVATFKSA